MWISDDEYDKIKKSFPIPCVDLLITNERCEILLVKRRNEPAKGEWWFPGGRVMYGEYRDVAAIRKSREECGIITHKPVEWKTIDIFLDDNDQKYSSHGISTIFWIYTTQTTVKLDEQSDEFDWKNIREWKKIISNDFLINILEEFSHCKNNY
jgi:ADP-ribose pyrophosphatase YjhB (NUDIX family)